MTTVEMVRLFQNAIFIMDKRVFLIQIDTAEINAVECSVDGSEFAANQL